MAGKYITASIKPPRRVQITKVDSGSGYWKPGQFGYAISYSTHPGMFTMDKGPSAPGELSYLSLIHISEPTRLRRISYAVFCLTKKKKQKNRHKVALTKYNNRHEIIEKHQNK